MIKVTNAATGCTIRMVESVDLVEVGRSKSLSLPSWPRDSVKVDQHMGALRSGGMAIILSQERTGRVADLNRAAGGSIAIAEHTKGKAVEGAQGYRFYDRSG